MSENGASEHPVCDLALASFLVASGHPIVRLERNGWKCRFVFRSSEDLAQDEMDFISRRATVEPLAFHEQVRLLKAMTQVGR